MHDVYTDPGPNFIATYPPHQVLFLTTASRLCQLQIQNVCEYVCLGTYERPLDDLPSCPSYVPGSESVTHWYKQQTSFDPCLLLRKINSTSLVPKWHIISSPWEEKVKFTKLWSDIGLNDLNRKVWYRFSDLPDQTAIFMFQPLWIAIKQPLRKAEIQASRLGQAKPWFMLVLDVRTLFIWWWSYF